MAIRNIIEEPNEILRKVCRPVLKVNDHIRQLLDDMHDTMIAADGVGLAAPQVGVLRQVVVISDGADGFIDLINPEILSTEGEQTGEEGCLSVPGRAGIVTRPMKVTFRGLNRDGEMMTYEGEGLLARAVCHEVDHLKGQLYIDIMTEEIFDDEEDK